MIIHVSSCFPLQLIERAIRVEWSELNAVHSAESEATKEVEASTEFSLTAIHVAFYQIQQRINDISVLSRVWPECVEKIHDFLTKDVDHPLSTKDEMVCSCYSIVYTYCF